MSKFLKSAFKTTLFEADIKKVLFVMDNAFRRHKCDI